MISLHPLVLERLKLMISASPKRALTMEEKISTLDILRSSIPDLFPGLSEEKLKDNNFLIKFLSDRYNKNRIKNALKKELSPDQQTELIQTLEEKPVIVEEDKQIIGQETEKPAGQEAQPTGGGSSGGMQFGMPPAPSLPSVPRINIPKKTPQPPKTEADQPSMPSGRRLNFSSIRGSLSSGFKSLQSFAAPANPFLKRNLSRGWQGFKNMFGNLGNAGGRTLVGGLNLGGNAGSRLANFRSSLGGNVKGAGNRASSAMKGGGKKFGLAFVGVFFLLFFTAAIGGMTGTTPTGEAAPITPGTGGSSSLDYKLPLKEKFNIDTGELGATEIQWAYEILNLSLTVAPKFQSLITAKPTAIKHGKSHTDNQNGISYIDSKYLANNDPSTFKLILIHELSHRIKGLAGNPSPACGLLDINKAYLGDLSYLTSYAANATSDPNKNCVTGGSDPDTRSDEDFAETMAYYINIDKSELNYGENCGTYGTTNPYNRKNTMTHKAYAKCLLGP